MYRTYTLSEKEKEEREDSSLIKPAPKKKPPRKDLKKNRVNDDSDKDSDKEQDKKDKSQNYKDATYRIALRYILSSGIERTETGWKATSGDKTEYFSSKEDAQNWLDNQGGGSDDGGDDTEDEDTEDDSTPSPPPRREPPQPRSEVEPLPEAGKKLEDNDANRAKLTEDIRKRGVATFNENKDKSVKSLKEDIENLEKEMEDLEDDDLRKIHMGAQLAGLKAAAVVKAGENAEGVGSATAEVLAFAKDDPEAMADLIEAEVIGASKELDERQQAVARRALQRVPPDDWDEMLDDDHPAKEIAKILADPDPMGGGRFLNEQQRAELAEMLVDIQQAEMAYTDPDAVAENGTRTVRENRDLSRRSGNNTPAPKPEDFDNTDDFIQATRDWETERLREQSRNRNPEPDTDDSDDADLRRRQEEQQRRLEEQRRRQEEEMRRRQEENAPPRTASIVKRYARNNNLFSINSLYYTHNDERLPNVQTSRTYNYREEQIMTISRRQARELTRAMDELAETIQKQARALGIPSKVAMDYALRTDMLSDAIEKQAGFDAGSIGEVVPGPLVNIPADPDLDGHFTQIDGEQLSDLQESGKLARRRASRRRAHQRRR